MKELVKMEISELEDQIESFEEQLKVIARSERSE